MRPMLPLTTSDLCGLWVPIITPFTEAGPLDEASLAGLAGRLLDDGATGLVPLGTTGEPATLSPEERHRVVAVCAQVAGAVGRPVIAGAGSNDTAGTVGEARRLGAIDGVGAVLVVVPYYTRPSGPAVVEHLELVADRSPVPVVAYNIPYRTGAGTGLDAGAIGRLARHPNVIGVKQAVGGVDLDTLQLLAEPAGDFALLAGDDAFIAPTVLLGGAGAIAAAAHLCTTRFASLVAAARAGDVATTRSLAGELLPVVRAGFAEPSPAVWKGALHRLGLIAHGGLRRPLTGASPRAVDRLLAAAAVATRQAGGPTPEDEVGAADDDHR